MASSSDSDSSELFSAPDQPAPDRGSGDVKKIIGIIRQGEKFSTPADVVGPPVAPGKINPYAPNGFVVLGEYTLRASHGIDIDRRQDVGWPLPPDIRVDKSYRMRFHLVTSGGGAGSPLTSADIPPGFFLYCEGYDTDSLRWAVLKPYSGEPILDKDVFRLGLYADNGNSPLGDAPTATTGMIFVRVSYKPL